MSTVKEATIVKNICDYLKKLDKCFFWKEHGGMYGTAGIPDIIVCYRGKFIALEAKRPGGKLTRLQAKAIKDIRAAEGAAYIVTSVEEVKEIMEG